MAAGDDTRMPQDVEAPDSPPPQDVLSPPEDVPAASHDFISSSCPKNAAESILCEAGPHTRAVCRAYHCLHPPLLSLAPHSTTAASLLAALPALPSILTSLNLCGMGSNTITPATLAAAIPAALPLLQQLKLPCDVSAEALQATLPTLQACPHLHTLLAPGRWGDIPEPAQGQGWPPTCWAPLQDPPTAARVRSLTLASTVVAHALAGPLAPLPHLTHLQLVETIGGIRPDHLRQLAADAPALRSLELPSFTIDNAKDFQPLTAFSVLSELSIEDACCIRIVPTGPLLHQLRALTTLCRLSLGHDHRAGWSPAEAGWLLRLTPLTRLDLEFCFSPGGVQEQALNSRITRAISEVATSLAPLPALRRLHLRFASDDSEIICDPSWLSCGQPGSFFRRLAAATQLRHLQLDTIPLPAAEACLLTSLQGLTSLRLFLGWASCENLQWVSALTRLEELYWHDPLNADNPAASQSLCQAAASLPQLHTLSLMLDDNSVLQPPHAAEAGLLTAVRDRVTRLRLLGWMNTEWEAESEPESSMSEGCMEEAG